MGTTHKKDNQRYYNPIRKAILNYKMIEPGEKVAIGLSGGKDSTTLLYLLDTIKKQKRLGFDFDLHPMILDMGMDMDLTPLKEFCESLGYELDIVPTDIAKIVFDIRQEKNPCSLCANLRRGILYQTAKERGCSKVALGHHLDDAIETFMMNWLFHGEFRSFEPMTYLTRSEVSIIRPLLYVVHAFLDGLSFYFADILNIRIGNSFSGGFIDFLLFGVLQGNDHTNWIKVIPFGLAWAVIYYFVFRFCIAKFKVAIPGMEVEEITDEANENVQSDLHQQSLQIIDALGGQANIESVTACATRLRVAVVDPQKVNKEVFKQLKATAVLEVKGGIQAVFGGKSDLYSQEINQILGHE